MAGIGFELKKLFDKKGLFAMARAYGYSGMICAGPMLLGVLLQLCILALCGWFGRSQAERELLVCMITHTLLASLTATGFFSMVTVRFAADMLYEERREAILPSFWGSSGVMLAAGGPLYGLFLLVSGANALEKLLCFCLFGELVAAWNAMGYLTAIRDYRGIVLSFAAAIPAALAAGGFLLWLGAPTVAGMLAAAGFGYGIMLIGDVALLYHSFPQGGAGAFQFLKWMDRFRPLAWTGLLLDIGLFSHLLVMWAGPLGTRLQGLWISAPYYDVPALAAFLTILVTTVNFVVSVEVRFYPCYRTYYALFNDKGAMEDIRQAESEMLAVLKSELWYTALKQLFTTALAISVGGVLLENLPLGFNDLMLGYFRTLCVGYGLYAIANTLTLLLLYFTDYRGALCASAVFAGGTTLCSVLSLLFSRKYFGFGFLLGSAAFFMAAVLRLEWFTGNLPYHILAQQPIVAQEQNGFFRRMEDFLERSLEEAEKR